RHTRVQDRGGDPRCRANDGNGHCREHGAALGPQGWARVRGLDRPGATADRHRWPSATTLALGPRFKGYCPSVDQTCRKERLPKAWCTCPQLLFARSMPTFLSILAPRNERAASCDLNPIGVKKDRFTVACDAPVVVAILIGTTHDSLRRGG